MGNKDQLRDKLEHGFAVNLMGASAAIEINEKIKKNVIDKLLSSIPEK